MNIRGTRQTMFFSGWFRFSKLEHEHNLTGSLLTFVGTIGYRTSYFVAHKIRFISFISKINWVYYYILFTSIVCNLESELSMDFMLYIFSFAVNTCLVSWWPCVGLFLRYVYQVICIIRLGVVCWWACRLISDCLSRGNVVRA